MLELRRGGLVPTVSEVRLSTAALQEPYVGKEGAGGGREPHNQEACAC